MAPPVALDEAIEKLLTAISEQSAGSFDDSLLFELEQQLQHKLLDITAPQWQQLLQQAKCWSDINEKNRARLYAAATIYRLVPPDCSGDSSKVDCYAQAKALYLRAAGSKQSPFPPAAFHLALLSLKGLGNTVSTKGHAKNNLKTASTYFRWATESGLPNTPMVDHYIAAGLYQIGRLYTLGSAQEYDGADLLWLKLSLEQAEHFYKKASEKSNLEAAFHTLEPGADPSALMATLLFKAEQHDLDALNLLAKQALNRANYEQAWLHYKEAAQYGSVEALIWLGKMAERGLHLHPASPQPDFAKAKIYYEQAIKYGFAPAYRFLASLYQRGLVEGGINNTQAKKLYEIAFNLGDIDAIASLGLLAELTEEPTEGSAEKRALDYYYPAQSLGNGPVFYQLARYDANAGENPRPWLQKAMQYRMNLAQLWQMQLHDHANFKTYLTRHSLGSSLLARCHPFDDDSDFISGQLHEKGWLTTGLNHAKARQHYQSGAIARDHRCLERLAYFHENGRAVEIDLAEAERLYRQAVELGNNDARVNLANLLLAQDADKHHEEAKNLYLAACCRNHPGAHWQLAQQFESVKMPQDDPKITVNTLRQKSVKLGYPEACIWKIQRDTAQNKATLAQQESLITLWYRSGCQQVLRTLFQQLTPQHTIEHVQLSCELIILYSEDSELVSSAMEKLATSCAQHSALCSWPVFEKIVKENPGNINRLEFLKRYLLLSKEKTELDLHIILLFQTEYNLNEEEQKLLAAHCKTFLTTEINHVLKEKENSYSPQTLTEIFGCPLPNNTLTNKIRFLDTVVVNPGYPADNTHHVHKLIACHRDRKKEKPTATLADKQNELLFLLQDAIAIILDNQTEKKHLIQQLFPDSTTQHGLEDEAEQVGFLRDSVCPKTWPESNPPYVGDLLRRLAAENKAAQNLLEKYQARCEKYENQKTVRPSTPWWRAFQKSLSPAGRTLSTQTSSGRDSDRSEAEYSPAKASDGL